MKNLLFKTQILILLAFSLNLSAQTSNSEILGVYQYQVEGIEGMSIISPTHFIWVISNKDRQPFSSADPSDEEKAEAYDALNIAAGTWEETGDRRIKFTYTHHVNASLIGQSFEWEYKKEGDQFNYWILQEDKSRGPQQQSRRIADWNAPGTCSQDNGTWEYVEWNGVYLQCGNYGAWVIQNELVKDASTVAGKAKAFEAMNGRFAIGDCREGKSFWNILHASDIRQEKAIIGCATKKLNDGRYKWQVLNVKGEPAGVTWHIQRIK